MPAIAERLQQYAAAIADPTRGMILIELDRVGEATATQLARSLNLTANNVYHHMRVLLELGVVDPPRSVPGKTFVEKYYSINSEIRAASRLDPVWYREVQESLTLEDRRALIVSICLTMAELLRQTARDYLSADAETVDRFVRDEGLVMLSINRVSREQLRFRIDALRDMLERANREFAEDLSPRTDLMLLAALPALLNRNGGSGE